MSISGIGSLRHGRTAMSLLAIAAVLALACPNQAAAFAKAPSTDITQAEYLQWLVKASAKKATLPERASAADYVKWAVGRGIQPDGGWKPDAQLTREVYAQTLAQLYGMPAQKDPVRALKDVGVVVPSTRLVSRRTVLQVFNDFGFQSGTAEGSHHPATPINHDPKVVICHKGQEIQVAQSAVPAHLAHGDYLGICRVDLRGKDKDKHGDRD